MDYNGNYPLNPSIIRGYKPPFLNPQYCAPPGRPTPYLKPTLNLGYWELLAPALLGSAGALFLSLFSDSDHITEHFGANIVKFAITGYAIGATIAVSYAVSKVLMDSLPPYDHLVLPISGALVTIIVLFGTNYLLLYRLSPSSFKGEVGNDFGTQLFSFMYLSVTTLATAGLGDIMPNDKTARALIAIEISFNLFTLATAIQLLLVQKH